MATTTAMTESRTGYLPSLDGWRALAIVGVLFAHDLPWSIWGFSNGLLLALGGFGVNLFFAISGILITTRILEEERACGAFNIKGFYVRRICRIQPAAMAYLGVIGLLMLFRVIEGRWSYWLAGLLMYENFVWHPSTVPFSLYEGHFWSLAVEEHFYILLSVILFFVLRRRLAWMIALYAVFSPSIALRSPMACSIRLQPDGVRIGRSTSCCFLPSWRWPFSVRKSATGRCVTGSRGWPLR